MEGRWWYLIESVMSDIGKESLGGHTVVRSESILDPIVPRHIAGHFAGVEDLVASDGVLSVR